MAILGTPALRVGILWVRREAGSAAWGAEVRTGGRNSWGADWCHRVCRQNCSQFAKNLYRLVVRHRLPSPPCNRLFGGSHKGCPYVIVSTTNQVYSHTSLPPSPSYMHSSAGCPRGTGAILYARTAAQVIRPLASLGQFDSTAQR